jgi:hypothetical protein
METQLQMDADKKRSKGFAMIQGSAEQKVKTFFVNNLMKKIKAKTTLKLLTLQATNE